MRGRPIWLSQAPQGGPIHAAAVDAESLSSCRTTFRARMPFVFPFHVKWSFGRSSSRGHGERRCPAHPGVFRWRGRTSSSRACALWGLRLLVKAEPRGRSILRLRQHGHPCLEVGAPVSAPTSGAREPSSAVTFPGAVESHRRERRTVIYSCGRTPGLSAGFAVVNSS